MKVICAHGVVLLNGLVYVKDGERWLRTTESETSPATAKQTERLTQTLSKYNEKTA